MSCVPGSHHDRVHELGVKSCTPQGPEQLVALLQAHLETGHWGPVVHIVHLVKFMAQCKPYMVKQLAAAGAPRALMGEPSTQLHGFFPPSCYRHDPQETLQVAGDVQEM